jgi:large subunit ribosomal protein L24
MAQARIKKDMQVMILSGASRGKSGKVIRIDRDKDRVWVEGINRGKKAIRRSQAKPQGGFEETERPLRLSKVMSLERWQGRTAKRTGAGAAVQAEGGKN